MIGVQETDFDVGQEYEALREIAGDAGAIVTFTGLVREIYTPESDKSEAVTELFLEHYPGMTEQRLEDIARQAEQRWPLLGVRIIHRIGSLKPGDQIVLVGTASAHRKAALESASFIMDYLKSHAPFWKKQFSSEGEKWIESRTEDAEALANWQK